MNALVHITAILTVWIIVSILIICSLSALFLLCKTIELCYKFYRKFRKGDE